MATMQLPTPERLAKDAVRALFKTLFNPRVSELRRAALAQNLIPEEVIEKCTQDGLSDWLRETLKEPDAATGLSLARPLGRGRDCRWYRVESMAVDEAQSLLDDTRAQIASDIGEYRKYERFFQSKFGEDLFPTFDFGTL